MSSPLFRHVTRVSSLFRIEKNTSVRVYDISSDSLLHKLLSLKGEKFNKTQHTMYIGSWYNKNMDFLRPQCRKDGYIWSEMQNDSLEFQVYAIHVLCLLTTSYICFLKMDPEVQNDSQEFAKRSHKHRKNCECCPGHYLIVDHYSSI